MTYVPEMWVLTHLDWYTTQKGIGYVPTEKAPPEAIIALKALNEYSDKGRTALMPDYPDIVPTHPDMSQEELKALIEKHMKEDEELTDWPDV